MERLITIAEQSSTRPSSDKEDEVKIHLFSKIQVISRQMLDHLNHSLHQKSISMPQSAKNGNIERRG
jgi:hypothetical protein